MPRLTIRLDDELMTRLALFAQGRSNGHPVQVSAIVREALEHYLKPRMRQTRQTPRVRRNAENRRL